MQVDFISTTSTTPCIGAQSAIAKPVLVSAFYGPVKSPTARSQRMATCSVCGGLERFGQVVHRPGCTNKPKVAGEKCSECGGAKTIRGFQHTPTCSKNIVAPKTHAAPDPYDAHFREMAPLYPIVSKKFSYEWWANHFYQECTPQDKKRFYKTAYRESGSLKPNFDPNSASKDEIAWLELLEAMLKAGFVEYPDSYKGVDDTLIPSLKEYPHLKLGFRGELRQPSQVKLHNGCTPKAKVVSLRKDMNMAAQWHPFSRPELRNKIYYRKGNGDNCLYTTVSIAYDFDTASKFPLLSDLRSDAPDAFGTATVEAAGIESNVAKLRAALGDTIAKQHFDPNWRATDAKPGYNPGKQPAAPAAKPVKSIVRLLPLVRMNVYLFRVRGNVWNTQAYQLDQHNAEFPERAMDTIPWGDFLARVRIDRIHYGEDSNDGHLGIVAGYDLLHSYGELCRLLGGGTAGQQAYQQMVQFLRNIRDKGKLNADGSGGIDFRTASSKPISEVKVLKVIRMEPRTDWGVVVT